MNKVKRENRESQDCQAQLSEEKKVNLGRLVHRESLEKMASQDQKDNLVCLEGLGFRDGLGNLVLRVKKVIEVLKVLQEEL